MESGLCQPVVLNYRILPFGQCAVYTEAGKSDELSVFTIKGSKLVDRCPGSC